MGNSIKDNTPYKIVYLSLGCHFAILNLFSLDCKYTYEGKNPINKKNMISVQQLSKNKNLPKNMKRFCNSTM